MPDVSAVSAALDAPKGARDLSAFPGLTGSEAAGIQALGRAEYAVWRHLANSLGQLLCRKCTNLTLREAGVHSDQLAGPIRNLRVAGYSIPKDLRVACGTHGSQTGDQLTALVPVDGASRLRFPYTPVEKKKMKAACGNADAYDGDRSGKLELDHRVPMIRAAADEERVDPADAEAVRATFMCLTGQHNLRKSRACESCVETGQRPVFFNGIPFWFEGGPAYDLEVGCNGCPWAYPERWNVEVAARFNETPRA